MSLLIDFYDVEVLSYAKNQLLDDISSMNLTIKMPHIPQRRDGDNRILREVDDIYTLFTVLHTHTHTHPFNGPLSGTTRVSRYQKGKPFWILLEQETVSGSGISWAYASLHLAPDR